LKDWEHWYFLEKPCFQKESDGRISSEFSLIDCLFTMQDLLNFGSSRVDISILIATYKRPDILQQTLESLCDLDTQGLKWEILLIDNGNDSHTRCISETFGKRLPLQYLLEEKRGRACALNHGIPLAKGSLILFTDDDIRPEHSWVREMWEGAQRWPSCLVFGGRIFPEFPIETLPWDLNSFTIRTAYGFADWGEKERVYPPINVWGANMAVRASVFQKGLRFNDEIWSGENPLAGEESELVTRISRQGHGPVYLPRSIVHHQIRPEQLTISWLKKRTFKFGRTHAFVTGLPNPQLHPWGMPRATVRTAIQHFIRYLKGFIFMTKHDRIQQNLLFCHYKGRVYQYWLGVPKKNLVDYN
jgi:glycosyltransferase involved in cell wall biosynthesis